MRIIARTLRIVRFIADDFKIGDAVIFRFPDFFVFTADLSSHIHISLTKIIILW